jgi:hypothetical protein
VYERGGVVQRSLTPPLAELVRFVPVRMSS